MNDNSKLKQLAYFYNEKLICPRHDPKLLSNYQVEVRPLRQEIVDKGEDQVKVTIVRVSCFDRSHGEESKWEGPLNEWYTACAEVALLYAEKVRYY